MTTVSVKSAKTTHNRVSYIIPAHNINVFFLPKSSFIKKSVALTLALRALDPHFMLYRVLLRRPQPASSFLFHKGIKIKSPTAGFNHTHTQSG